MNEGEFNPLGPIMLSKSSIRQCEFTIILGVNNIEAINSLLAIIMLMGPKELKMANRIITIHRNRGLAPHDHNHKFANNLNVAKKEMHNNYGNKTS